MLSGFKLNRIGLNGELLWIWRWKFWICRKWWISWIMIFLGFPLKFFAVYIHTFVMSICSQHCCYLHIITTCYTRLVTQFISLTPLCRTVKLHRQNRWLFQRRRCCCCCCCRRRRRRCCRRRLYEGYLQLYTWNKPCFYSI